MTDPTPQTTPTRDEAVTAANGDNRPFPNYEVMPDPTDEMLTSPQFEAIWNVIKSWDVNVPEAYSGYCGANGSHVAMILRALAAAPAPASGRVDAVRRTGAEMIARHRFRLDSDNNCAEIDSSGLAEEIDAALASLSPAATPVSEAGGDDWMERKAAREKRKAEIMQEYAWGNLTPLGVANHLKRAGFNIDYAVKVSNTLAKPASSPAGGEPTGNSGLLLGEASADDAPCYLSSEHADSWAKGFNAAVRALSQSTSAGRVGE